MIDKNTLTEQEQEFYAENIGKLLEGGMDEVEAEKQVLGDIIAAREKAKKKKAFPFIRISDIPLNPPQWLVKGFIETDSFCSIFGEPGCGKSFLSIDLAASIATGTPFFGMKTAPGPVFYIAGEGKGGIARRFRAWSMGRGVSIENADLYLNKISLQLIDDTSVSALMSTLGVMTEEAGKNPQAIILDTYSRNLGGDDSSPQDSSQGVAAIDLIKSRFPGVCVIVIHHSGLNQKERSRGWSGLRAAVDTEFCMTSGKDNIRRLEQTKSKEAEIIQPLAFTLCRMDLGIADEDGEAVTSAVLSQTEWTEPPDGRTKAAGTRQADKALEILKEMEEVQGNNPYGILEEAWRKRCENEGIPRQRTYECKKILENEDKISCGEHRMRSL